MSTLPYFKWYAADAEGDDFYLSLTDAELATYHRLLNRSWMNDGIPADLDQLGAILRRPPSYIKKIWPKLSQRWKISPRDPTKLVNPRQELELTEAIEVSNRNRRPGNTNAKRHRVLVANESRFSETPRAYESVCVSDSLSSFPQTSTETSSRASGAKTLEVVARPSMRFEEWWERYPLKNGKNVAAGVWIGIVTIDNENAVFACLERYLASDHVARGIVMRPNNWLHDCSRDGWASEWPLPVQPKRNGYQEPERPADTWNGEGDTLPAGFENWTEKERQAWLRTSISYSGPAKGTV